MWPEAAWKRRAALLGAVTLIIVAAAALHRQGWWGLDESLSSPVGGAAPVVEEARIAPEQEARPPGAAAAHEVSATDLFKQYRESAGRVDGRYRGQRLVVKGPVASAEQGGEGVTLLTLSAGPDLEHIRAVVTPADQDRAAVLPTGAPVTLDCLHHGMVMGEPVLADCRLSR